MPRMRLIRANSPIMIDQEVSPTDAIGAPVGTSIINPDHYDAMVQAAGSEGDLMTAMGVHSQDYSTMTLDDVKKQRKKIVAAQARSSFDASTDFFDAINSLIVMIGAADPIDRTKPAYVKLKKDVVAYKQAVKSAKDAIDAATTVDAVMAISFVAPA
jgi:hypothetical protein